MSLKGLLSRKRRLGGSRDVLEYKIVLMGIQPQFDDRIPVFPREIILVHSFDDLINGRLINTKRVNVHNKKQGNELGQDLPNRHPSEA